MGLDAARRLEQTISTRNAKTRTVLELLFSVLGASSGRAHEAGAPLQLPHLQVKVHQECTNKTDVLLGGTPIFPHHYISSPVILPVCRLSEARTSSACSYMLKSKWRRRVSIADANANTLATSNCGDRRHLLLRWPLPSRFRFRLEEAHAPDAYL